MADVLPLNFPIVSENINTIYDYMDVADGTGIVELEGYESVVDTSAGASSAVETKSLSRNASYSFDTNSTGAFSGSSTTYSLFQTYNFDQSPFNTPKVAKGKAKVNLTFGTTRTSGSDLFQGYIKVSIIRLRGAAETIVGTYFTLPVGDNSTDSVYTTTAYPLNEVTLTETNFQIGDILRLKLEFYGRSSGGAAVGGSLIIAHDPQNNPITNFNTPATSFKSNSLKLSMPYKITS